MCGCLVVLLGTAFPRIAVVLTWIFTDRLGRAFDDWWLPLLGFVFLPYTTFFWVVAYAPLAGVTGLGWFVVTAGFLMDLGALSGASGYGRRRVARPGGC
ncbi:MAG: hypothetical protein KatS3mg009_1453 [Acidimicrobiia bacterium]|nr:MAG: hypothetical protein KatS3mg009_1453 [Acidimicrobiia bacterium]